MLYGTRVLDWLAQRIEQPKTLFNILSELHHIGNLCQIKEIKSFI